MTKRPGQEDQTTLSLSIRIERLRLVESQSPDRGDDLNRPDCEAACWMVAAGSRWTVMSQVKGSSSGGLSAGSVVVMSTPAAPGSKHSLSGSAPGTTRPPPPPRRGSYPATNLCAPEDGLCTPRIERLEGDQGKADGPGCPTHPLGAFDSALPAARGQRVDQALAVEVGVARPAGAGLHAEGAG
jgi:hypothetical protein